MLMQSPAIFSAKPAWAPLGVKALYRTSSGDSNSMAAAVPGPKWAQKTITLPPHRRGCHLVTSQILREIRPDLSEFKCGLAHLFLHHTSASLTINENYDSDVRDDTETFLNKIVPELSKWCLEFGCPFFREDLRLGSIYLKVLMICQPISNHQCLAAPLRAIPITDGRLNMGTWQGIWLCEHRDAPTARKVVVTLNGI
ncbi:UPF0047 protein YjbQ-like - like 1 [Theobroma cacao]|nr:UPF0047 protein YjbQ-like - like 1 [Theobroma cacao]